VVIKLQFFVQPVTLRTVADCQNCLRACNSGHVFYSPLVIAVVFLDFAEGALVMIGLQRS